MSTGAQDVWRERRMRPWRRAWHLLPALGLIAPLFVFSAASAQADLKLCNSTSSRIGVAVGYHDQNGWATEGWWNIASQTCETLLKGAVPSRFVYVHAVDYDRGGEWAGKNFMCTAGQIVRDPGGYKIASNAAISARGSSRWTPARRRSGPSASPILRITGRKRNET